MKISTAIFLFLFFFCGVIFSSDDALAPLVEKGKLLLEQGSYEAGIAVLETVMGRDPKNSEAIGLLVNAYDTYSQKLLNEGRFELAKTYMTKMEALIPQIDLMTQKEFKANFSKLQSRIKRETAQAKTVFLDTGTIQSESADELVSMNSGRHLYNQAVGHFKKHEYEIAENLLKESIKLDPSNAQAYEVLGYIANLNQKLDEAELYYRKAFSVSPTPELRERIEKLMFEKKVDDEQQEYLDEHFIIRYRRSESLEGSEIREYLREAYKMISQEFGYYPSYKIPVIIYSADEYQAISETPNWSAALYDGKIRIPYYRMKRGRSELRRLVYHELTHAFILDISKGQCPIWLHEGLAQYEESRVQKINVKLLDNALKQNLFIEKDELTLMNVVEFQDQSKGLLFYLESYSFVNYLINRFRFHKIKELLVELGKKTPFEKAFDDVFSSPFSVIWGDWKTTVLKTA